MLHIVIEDVEANNPDKLLPLTRVRNQLTHQLVRYLLGVLLEECIFVLQEDHMALIERIQLFVVQVLGLDILAKDK